MCLYSQVGRHPHPGAMESMRLVTRDISGESLGHREMEADQVTHAYYVFTLL